VTIRFAATGFSGYSSTIITIDGATYAVSDLSWRTFSWRPGDTHQIQAVFSFKNTDSPQKNYTFSSWTNGGGLTGASGTYTVPNADATVTANYVLVTHTVSFAISGVTNYSGNILIIDGVTYPLSDFTWRTFAWDNGTVHTVQAITPIKNTDYPQKTFAFQSWTNGGSSLTGASGTITMPNNDVSVTANYASPTYLATFAADGLTYYSSDVIKIDGTTYTYSDLAWRTFAWDAGTTHTIQALTPVKNTESPAKWYNFSSWTNGNGLMDASGTFTMPNQDVAVTENYVQSSVHVAFATNGLNNVNSGVTILSVDGANYDIYNVPNINNALQWNITSTHTVAAAQTVTAWDGTKYAFTGWTNGNGLTANSGILTTPASDVVVTANYAIQPSGEETALTISCNQPSVDKGNTVTISGQLICNGAGVACKTVALSYYDGSNWILIASVTTATDGGYSYDWAVPQELQNGMYPVKADFLGDSSYLASSALTGSGGNGPLLQVLPESWGSIVALVACFGGALLFIKVYTKRFSKKGG
jgi:hypothetical protein